MDDYNSAPQPPQQPPQTPQQPPNNGMAIAALVCGIVGLVFSLLGPFAWVGIIVSIVGLILAVMAKKQIPPGQPTGMATAGLVCSIVALALSTILFISCALCVSGINSALSSLQY